jgi:predicted transposase/invertase (TIGR01784 family)
MDPVIKKAEDRLEWLSGDEETIRLYEAREFSKYERNSIISSAKQTGREEGLQEGKKEGMKEGMKTGMQEGEKKAAKEIAQNLLSMGIEPAKVARATGLSKQEVEQLSRDTK